METPLAIYRIVHIKLLTHTKTHTHIYIYKSVCVFLCVCVCVYTNGCNESNKLRTIDLCPLHHLSIALTHSDKYTKFFAYATSPNPTA